VSDPDWQEHGFVVSSREWPIVRVQYPENVALEAYRALFGHYASLASRGARVAWLVDLTRFDPLTAPAAHRRVAAEIFEEHRATLLAATVCEARVLEAAITRGVVTAFDWLTLHKWPCTNVATEAEARAWIAEKMNEERARSL
jgi:hypothetical protein